MMSNPRPATKVDGRIEAEKVRNILSLSGKHNITSATSKVDKLSACALLYVPRVERASALETLIGHNISTKVIAELES